MLRSSGGGDDDCNVQVLKESIDTDPRGRVAPSSMHRTWRNGSAAMRPHGPRPGSPADEIVELVYAPECMTSERFRSRTHCDQAGSADRRKFAHMKQHARVGAEIVATIPAV